LKIVLGSKIFQQKGMINNFHQYPVLSEVQKAYLWQKTESRSMSNKWSFVSWFGEYRYLYTCNQCNV